MQFEFYAARARAFQRKSGSKALRRSGNAVPRARIRVRAGASAGLTPPACRTGRAPTSGE
jgi:hypothetical protein